jgi:biotin transport system substrate-specific component
MSRGISRDFGIVLFASLIICLSGKISIPLWFTPVPMALQNSMVLLIAAFLGAKRGTVATFAFLAQGAMGLPVFSTGAGFAILLGPTGGYLLGYLAASFVTGYLAERGKLFTALCAGNGVIYLFGALYLGKFVGMEKAFALGVVPFLFGDLLKLLISFRLLRWKSS